MCQETGGLYRKVKPGEELERWERALVRPSWGVGARENEVSCTGAASVRQGHQVIVEKLLVSSDLRSPGTLSVPWDPPWGPRLVDPVQMPCLLKLFS